MKKIMLKRLLALFLILSLIIPAAQNGFAEGGAGDKVEVKIYAAKTLIGYPNGENKVKNLDTGEEFLVKPLTDEDGNVLYEEVIGEAEDASFEKIELSPQS